MKYDEINDALKRVSGEIDAAEAHGVLCGLICARNENVREHFLKHCIPDIDRGDLLVQETMNLLQELYSDTQTQFMNSDFLFYPLLPDEGSSLAARVEALGFWCQGFLLGISLGGIVNTEKLPGELPGFIKDVIEVSQAESFDLEDEEQDEGAYIELVEYIKVGALLFHEEIRSLTDNTEQPTMH
ncbi:MAG: UPF0149 family protein [Gammaproteobacteria bacterium]|nr:UPF0149 family protein [Gammaproteobacteria bacterium]